MALDRGLPAVPRGLTRELTAFLQAQQNIILGMSGLGRGTTETRAMRVYERASTPSGQRGVSGLSNGSVLSAHIATGAITESKIADSAVSGAKIATSAIESRHVKPGVIDTGCLANDSVTIQKLVDGSVNSQKLAANAVTTTNLADGAITRAKLSEELIPQVLEGSAEHGATINLGKWLFRPVVAIRGYSLLIENGGSQLVRIDNLREENGVWLFDAIAICDMSLVPDMLDTYGKILWIAFGWRVADANP